MLPVSPSYLAPVRLCQSEQKCIQAKVQGPKIVQGLWCMNYGNPPTRPLHGSKLTSLSLNSDVRWVAPSLCEVRGAGPGDDGEHSEEEHRHQAPRDGRHGGGGQGRGHGNRGAWEEKCDNQRKYLRQVEDDVIF